MADVNRKQIHSNAWIFQSWASFVLSVGGLSMGILCLPVDPWIKGYMGMGTAFAVGSTLSLAKTTRDLHETKSFNARLDEARVEKLLADHNPLN
jgi:hypothetical protein